ncbi:MAG: carboxypeptidase regulatory-like domain-containing protein, partial [Sphingomonadales bacterium]|nr:carboxypeptidase regulatory-like domain-containing protein [Sphingomonadales bacterium]
MLSLFRSIRCYWAFSFWILLVTAPGFGVHGMENKVHMDAAVPIKVRGRVLDTQGKPVAYATVVMEPGQWTGLSNENGLYEIMIPAGDYVVYCS